MSSPNSIEIYDFIKDHLEIEIEQKCNSGFTSGTYFLVSLVLVHPETSGRTTISYTYLDALSN